MKKLDLGKAIAATTKSTFVNNKLISDEQVKKNIEILEELRVFIPPLGAEEFSLLEQNIIKNGCRDALTLWETKRSAIEAGAAYPDEPIYVLVDGHNRFQICKKNNLNFSVQLMPFNSKEEVKDYMIDLQLGRRNLSPEQVSYFRGLRFLNEKTGPGKYDRTGHWVHNEPNAHAPEKGRTVEKLAKEYKVGTSTIKRDAQFAEGLSKVEPTLRNEILTGKRKIDKKIIQTLGRITDDIEPISTIVDIEKVVEASGLGYKPVAKNSKPEVNYEGLSVWTNNLTEQTEKVYTTRSKEDFDDLKRLLDEYGAFLGIL
ncbi:hypothetical protein VB264_08945 [Arcicella aquatica]|uniref:ParB/Sulfiredoxin domain-containing protein n=1 Tax=Arcicella aquatica TaxID=217141 RepID=A0ABU5QLH5_9BACT|nr:hypothetical protein [Arcicella aquatica]MEA5257912.1 hypothetical protein [Arcicella aquatica]